MKKIFFLLFLIPVYANCQHASCCSMSSTAQFAQLASNEEFVASHLAPLPLEFTPAKGTMITFSCSDGKTANAFEVKATKSSDNWIIVIHEWWGLNDYIKREAERLQTEVGDINVLAVDLYDGKVAETPAMAQSFMGALDDKRARSVLQGALSHVGSSAKIQTIGWCMGGGWSMQTALMGSKQTVGCVMYYGMPEKDLTKLKGLNSEVLGIFASKDEWISPTVVAQFQKDMKMAGKKLTVKSYNADHAFANPSNPKFDKVSAEDAHKLAVTFLKTHFK